MPYIARLFQEVTGRDLSGLGDYTGWVGQGGYYRWKLSELGQLESCPCLHGQPVSEGPIGQPSGWPARRSAQTGASTLGTSGRQQGRNQPTSNRGRKPPTSTRGRKPASAARGRKRTASGDLVDLPSEREGACDGRSWHDRAIQEAEQEEGGSWDPPYPIGPIQARGGL